LRAAPAVIDTLQGKTNEIAEEEGFDGRVMLAADPTLEQADCRVEWRGAGAERTGATLEAAINDLLARHFADTAPIALTPTEQTED
jgi:flagellar assembly protein FliH